MREAIDSLDTVVAIDVAMTETARHAHYVLPASSQYEKWEATFFTFDFPHNYFQFARTHHRAVAGHAARGGDSSAPGPRDRAR